MKLKYDRLGKHIRLIDNRNNDLITERVLGINIDKYFMPSVANVIGTDLSKYKLIQRGNFACNSMHVGRDERLFTQTSSQRLFLQHTLCLKLLTQQFSALII